MPYQTALYHQHVQAKAKLVDFAGWEMPLQYESITGEHKTVRERAGIFDVGHMGRFAIRGEKAGKALERVVACRVLDLTPGRIRYTVVCNAEGGVRDDILVSCLAADRYLLVVNASNREKLLQWFNEHLGSEVELKDQTFATGMIAIQGPDALRITRELLETEVDNIQYYHGREHSPGVLVSRTGYTGEDGFEIIAPNERMTAFWDGAVKAGAKPAGLGARDSLRLEAGYPLYGHEIDEETSPLEAGLGWVVHLDKEEFIGKDALVKQKADGLPRRRIGFVVENPGIPRQGFELLDEDHPIGRVTSGGFSPILQRGIGLGLVEAGHAKPSRLAVMIRGKAYSAEVKKTPFVEKKVQSD